MQHRSEETRLHILDAALKRFAMDGYNAASVDAICSEADVSKGAFYHHFPSKQAVFLALFEGWLQTVDVGLNAAPRESVPQTLLHMTAMLPAIFAAADSRLPMFLEFWLQASRDETVWRKTIEPYRRYREYFAGMIEQGISEGSLAEVDPLVAAQVIVSLAVGMLLQGLLDPQGVDWEKVGKESMQILMNGLAR